MAMTCFEVVYYYVWFLYAGQWVVKYYQHFLHVPVLRIPTVESFLVVFSIDFFYREILCWGYIVDPLQICFRYSTLSERSRGAYANTILAVLSTVVGCGLTFGLTASLSRALPRLFPKPDWAAWDLELHSNSMVSCFLAEFCLTGIHYAMTVQTIVLNSLVNQQHTHMISVKLRSMRFFSSFIVAALTSLGSAVTKGGPMLNPVYTILAGLARRHANKDWLLMTIVLLSAQVLAAAVAYRAVRLKMKQD
ncbi:MAG: hypothetical protein KVP17_005249 [Porospora cf. gigantea B]|uniref:uncharacterized protein n=1 Tax=Porospora cf. gigantea B TaxID=2853592 RepID=UPI003571A776|nr:MAG: hypothetical protein KVP17_005249 [Porospora cf. gigantea B]